MCRGVDWCKKKKKRRKEQGITDISFRAGFRGLTEMERVHTGGVGGWGWGFIPVCTINMLCVNQNSSTTAEKETREGTKSSRTRCIVCPIWRPELSSKVIGST